MKAGVTSTCGVPPRFADRLLPAPVGGGFAMDGWWVWCGSVVRGEDGRWHMFAARWPMNYPMFQGYTVRSEIVRAVADSPEGPYTFAEVVLAPRGEDYWDGRMTHNPTICRCGDKFLLFYIGSTFPGPVPGPDDVHSGKAAELSALSWRNIRIGLATAKSVLGPWARRDTPILLPRPGQWDHYNTSNPAPCVHSDGSVSLIYRSSSEETGMRLGFARARQSDGPYVRVQDGPLRFNARGIDLVMEDPFLWHNGAELEMLAKDCNGKLTGEKGAGAHARSADGVDWCFSDPPQAYSRRVLWSDGRETVQGSLERPFLLFQDGEPTHLFAATGDGPGGFMEASRTWNMVIPLRSWGGNVPGIGTMGAIGMASNGMKDYVGGAR